MNFEHIYSIKDERVVQARELTTARGRKEGGKCLVEGITTLEWALAAQKKIEHVFVVDGQEGHELIAQLAQRNVPCIIVSDGVMKKITETNYVVPMVGVVSYTEQPAPTGDFLVVFDDVRDHGNIGAIVRSAAAFGVNNIVLTDDQTDLFFRKSVDASRGKVFEANVARYASPLVAVTNLQKLGYQVVATSPHAPVLQSLAPLQKKPVALILGNETNGVCQEVIAAADILVQIPMSSHVESLNVAVAAGISLYELKMRMILTMLTEKIKSNLGRNVNVAGKLIQMAFDVELKKITNYSSLQVVLLMILKCDVVMSYDQVAKDTATSGQERDQLLKPLMSDGYLEQIEVEGKQCIRLTPQGEEFLAKLWGVAEKCEDRILEGFTRQEREQLDDMLVRIQKNCENMIKTT